MKGKRRNGSLWLAVAAAMMVPAKARARDRGGSTGGGGTLSGDDTATRQSRRRADRRGPQVMRPVASPCGRHVAEVIGGAMFIDGRRVRGQEGNAYVLAPPTWRRDGRAVAWLERSRGEPRLVVVALDAGPEVIPWVLPAVSTDDRVFWAGPRRVVIGPAMLAPRAVATWVE